MFFDSSRYHVPSSNSIAGYLSTPVFSARSRGRPGHGPGTRSYSTPASINAFSTRQHGCPESLTHWFLQRCSFTAIDDSFLACAYDTPVRRPVQRAGVCAFASIFLVAVAPAATVPQRRVTLAVSGSGKAFWKHDSKSETARLGLRYRWHGT